MSEELRHGILVVDYGSKYSLLLARKIREQGTYTEVWAANDPRLESLMQADIPQCKGLILSGGHEILDIENPPPLVGGLLDLRVPILALGACAQLVGEEYGAQRSDEPEKEHITKDIRVKGVSALFSGFGAGSSLTVWSPAHRAFQSLPSTLRTIAEDDDGQALGFVHTDRRIYGLFFQPQASQTDHGGEVLRNFVHEICAAPDDWNMGDFLDRAIASVRQTVGDARVICALSGGVDSSVVAALLSRAIGKQLTCIFVDTGVLRMNERHNVERMVREHFDVDLRVIDASERFLNELKGVEEPERKRKIIGEQFIRVFEEVAREIPNARYLAQGTLYPDVVESVKICGKEVAVKSHHNVGGLPEDMNFELIEPLRELFKDEVRELGRQLGLPEEAVGRHPFPGPGLAVRILGEVTPERVATVQHADDIFIRKLREHKLYHRTWQAFVVLIPVKTVGFTGESRSYEWLCSLRAVNSSDGMTAEPTELPHEFLTEVSEAIIRQVPRINRVVYDISSKPPATIEWE